MEVSCGFHELSLIPHSLRSDLSCSKSQIADSINGEEHFFYR